MQVNGQQFLKVGLCLWVRLICECDLYAKIYGTSACAYRLREYGICKKKPSHVGSCQVLKMGHGSWKGIEFGGGLAVWTLSLVTSCVGPWEEELQTLACGTINSTQSINSYISWEKSGIILKMCCSDTWPKRRLISTQPCFMVTSWPVWNVLLPAHPSWPCWRVESDLSWVRNDECCIGGKIILLPRL